jgi:tetratricopeptide (TPR) repeat protein
MRFALSLSMPKKTLVLFFILCFSALAKAQTADEVYAQYLYFNLDRLQGGLDDALKLGEKILPNADKLPDKSRVAFYNGIGKLYEDDKQTGKAIKYYELVAAAEPDFYVVNRALGYLYLTPANELYSKLQANKNDKQLVDLYKTAVLKALPHLEKAQTCDPSDETLALIKTLYANIHDDAGLKSLNDRLKELGKNCVSILVE